MCCLQNTIFIEYNGIIIVINSNFAGILLLELSFMDVAAMSVVMRQGQLMHQVGVSVMKKAMESAEISTEALLKVLEQSVQPNLGQNIDIRL